MARMTLWGMYQYDPTLMDGVQVPDGASKDLLINSIMERSGDLYPYYQVPPRVKMNISLWFEYRKTDLNAIWRALTEEYNPIHNYDRHEERENTDSETVMETGSLQQSGEDSTKVTGGSTGTSQNSGTDVRTIDNSADSKTENTGTSSQNSSGTNTTNVSAFDAEGYVPREQASNSGTQSGNTSDKQEGLTHEHTQDSYQNGLRNETQTTQNRTDTITYGRKDVTDRDITRDTKRRESLHAYGNIGVTTSQKMIEAEIELRKRNWYEIVCEMFEEHFLLQVY